MFGDTFLQHVIVRDLRRPFGGVDAWAANGRAETQLYRVFVNGCVSLNVLVSTFGLCKEKNRHVQAFE